MAESGELELKSRLRTVTANERLRRRQELFDKHRNLKGNLKNVYDEKDVAEAVRTLSQGNAESKHESFAILKAAFLQDPKLVISFIKIDGALYSLVGYILCSDAYLQLLAMECCCNIALGGSRICYKLAKAVTPYLINILQGSNFPLMDVALQILINLSGSGEKTCRLLHSQGILNTYIRTVAMIELTELTAKALVMIFKYLKTIKIEEIEAVFSAVLRYFESSPYIKWLFFLFSTIPIANFLLVKNNVHMLSLGILNKIESLNASTVMSVTALLRIVGNLCSEKETAYNVLKNSSPILKITDMMRKSYYKFILKETQWCLGSAFRHIPNDQLAEFKPLLIDISRLTESSRL